MNDTVRDTLKVLVTQHGAGLCLNRQRLEGMLRDYCGEHRREVNVLVTAVREGVVEELLDANGTRVDVLLVRRLVARLRDEAAMDEAAATWAVETWTDALGKTVVKQTQPPATPAQPTPKRNLAPHSSSPAMTPKSAVATPAARTPVNPRTPAAKGVGGMRLWGLVFVIVAGGFGTYRVLNPPSAVQTRAEVHPPATAQRGDAWTNPRDGAVMLYIPSGNFLMGESKAKVDALLRRHSDWQASWFTDEEPQRRVYLDGYWIDKYEVTVAQYRKFCQAIGRQMPDAPSWGWQDDHPIVNVTWNDAKAYADWTGGVLPTGAEWEKAARGTDGREYPWGNEWDSNKCANGNNSTSTRPVGSYPSDVSPYGVMDMAGNVSEWCADWYDANYYATAPGRNPTGPASGQYRVLRGGSWFGYDVFICRAAGRCYGDPDYAYGSYGYFVSGFRVVVQPGVG